MSNTSPRFDPVAAPLLPATPERTLPPGRLDIDWLRQRFSCPPPLWHPEPEPVVVRGGPVDDAQLLRWLEAQDSHPEAPGTQDRDMQRPGSLASCSQNTGIQNPGTRHTGIPHACTQHTGTPGFGFQQPGSRVRGAPHSRSQDPGLSVEQAFLERASTGELILPPRPAVNGKLDAIYRKADVPAAVLIALVPQAEGPGVVLTVRSRRLRKHRGQIAFPGGRVDAGDASVEAAALREAQEEIGLDAGAVQVLGRLPPHPTGTGFHVHPVVGVVDAAQRQKGFVAAPDEVDEVFVVPLSFLMNPANHRRHLARWQEDGEHYSMRFYSMPWRSQAGQEYFIWGATATMLRNLYRFLAAD